MGDDQHNLQAAAGMVIRPAKLIDLASVAALSVQWSAQQITRGYRPDTPEALRARIGDYFLVADLGGRVVGYVIGEVRATAGNEFVENVLDDRPEYLEVQDLYVDVEHRGHGIGTKLMRAVLAAAEHRGVAGSLVYSANRDYLRTARFYERLGYDMWHIHMTRKPR
jgi:GNAT superfamily N-acetyltransferase